MRSNACNRIRLIAQALGVLIALTLCSATAALAEVSVSEDWDELGSVSLETESVLVVFSREDAGILVYSKSGQEKKQRMKIVPFYSQDSKARSTVRCDTITTRPNHVEVSVVFSAGQKDIRGNFSLDNQGTLKVKPSANMNGIAVFSPIRYGVLPGRILDDVIYDPKKLPARDRLHLPSERSFVGLLEGRDGLVVCAWPEGNQRIEMLLEDGEEGVRRVKAIELELDGRSAYLRVLAARGMWHEHKLLVSYLEKDVEIGWKRPFSAKWKTHLVEGEPLDIQTAFAFRNGKGRIWRPGGTFTYPVWFEGEKAFLHFSKKVPPVGEVLIYPLEGREDTPAELATRCVGTIPALRKGGPSIRRVGRPGMRACDGRDYMVKVFRVGLQTRERTLVHEALDDFAGEARVFGKRLSEYHTFIQSMKTQMDSWKEKEKGNPEVLAFLDNMRANVEKLREGYGKWMGDRTAAELLQYELEAIKKLRALVDEEGVETFPEAKYLLWESNRSGSLIEVVSGRVGGLARQWSREAALGCVANVTAAEYAEEIREEIRSFMANDRKCETVY